MGLEAISRQVQRADLNLHQVAQKPGIPATVEWHEAMPNQSCLVLRSHPKMPGGACPSHRWDKPNALGKSWEPRGLESDSRNKSLHPSRTTWEAGRGGWLSPISN